MNNNTNRFKKRRRGKLKKFNFKNNYLNFGTYGLKVLNSGIITTTQIEAARQAIARKTGRKGKLWVKMNPDTPITSKSFGSRMGKGKGSIAHWGYKAKAGSVIFEICGVTWQTAQEAFKTGGAKLPLKTVAIF